MRPQKEKKRKISYFIIFAIKKDVEYLILKLGY